VEGEKRQRMEGTGMQGWIEGREHPDVGQCFTGKGCRSFDLIFDVKK